MGTFAWPAAKVFSEVDVNLCCRCRPTLLVCRPAVATSLPLKASTVQIETVEEQVHSAESRET